MKLNISCSTTGQQKMYEITDPAALAQFQNRQIGSIVNGDLVMPVFAGYTFCITGGCDKQGFPMLDGIMTSGRVRTLLKKGMPCFVQKRKGEMRRKTVRGCIVNTSEIAVLCLKIIEHGKDEIEGLTNEVIPNMRGPMRANKIRRAFNLSKEDDVNDYIPKRIVEKNGKTRVRCPKVHRLLTDKRKIRKQEKIERRKGRKENAEARKKEYFRLLKSKVEAAN